MTFRFSLQPLRVGSRQLSRRVFVPAHSYGFASDEQGMQDMCAYVERRLQNGVPMVVVGEAEVSVPALGRYGVPPGREAGQASIRLYRRLAALANKYEAALVEQLHHPGGQVWFEEQRPAYAPSSYPQARSYTMPLELDVTDIGATVLAFGAAAAVVKEAGLAGVEIKADQGKLLHQFLSRRFNLREDEYGGSLENRMRALIGVLSEIRRQCGRDFLIGVRLSGPVTEIAAETEAFPGGDDITMEETMEISKVLSQSGMVDYLSFSGESNSTVWGYWRSHGDEYVPAATFADVTRLVKQAVSVPVFLSGRILTLDAADELLEQGYCDAVGMARAFVADAELLRPYLGDRDSSARPLRPCISCNQSCVGSTWYGGTIGCIYDPLSGREGRFPRRAGSVPNKKFAVVGGGPAGLEFARTASELGAQVALFERDDRLGGRLWQWSELPGRQRIRLAIDFWRESLGRHPRVSINLNASVVIGDLDGVDAVIWAAGGTEALPPFAADRGGTQSLTPSMAMARENWRGSHVLVFEADRFSDPLGVALLLAQRGARVEIATPFDQTGLGLDPVSRAARLFELAKHGVSCHLWTDVRLSAGRGALLFEHGANRLVALATIDVVVWCINRVPERKFTSEEARPASFLIGDALWPRGLEVVTKEAHDLAHRLILRQEHDNDKR